MNARIKKKRDDHPPPRADNNSYAAISWDWTYIFDKYVNWGHKEMRRRKRDGDRRLLYRRSMPPHFPKWEVLA